jgi:hypothetical protein
VDALRRDLPRILESLSAIAVGTRDDGLVPACTLAAGAQASEDGRVTIYIPEAIGTAIFANVAANGAVAVVLEHIPTHRSVQVKGRCVEMRVAREDERDIVEKSQAAFFDVVELIGAPSAVRRRRRWPCRAITIEVTDVFEQTPGPRAGAPYENPPS